MGIVDEFAQSDDLGRDVTRDEFLTKILDELPLYPNIILVAHGTTFNLLKRDKVHVRVKTEDNGSST